MLRLLEYEEVLSFNKVKNKVPNSRILVKINSLDDSEGVPVAVSDSAESDDALCEKLHEYLNQDILCVIVGSYMQKGSTNVIYSIR